MVELALRVASTGGILTAQDAERNFDEIRGSSQRITHDETTADAIRRYFRGDGVQVALKRVSLICPISKTRIVTAARGADCKHLECFDLRNYLLHHTTMTYWECPFASCKAETHLNQLRIDAYVQL
ncbi:zinc finger MIZ domain-containing protein 1-like protein [Aphelenchoides avenae]|nr:zinc finger MIZ domain-containing protein 1-like protein [Aphelenchus avenae]